MATSAPTGPFLVLAKGRGGLIHDRKPGNKNGVNAAAGTGAAALALFDRDGRLRQKICWIARQHVLFERRLALDCRKFSNISALVYLLYRATIILAFENV